MNNVRPTFQSELPESDLELLSAYLDNELSVSERTGLDRRLAAEPDLRRELAELGAARGALREQEWLRPPRSFALTPEMAGRPRQAGWALSLRRWLQPIGGLAALALVALLSLQLIAGQGDAFVQVGAPIADNEPPAPMAAFEAPAAAPAATSRETADGAPEQAPAATQAPDAAMGAAASGPAVPPNAGGPPAIDMPAADGAAAKAPAPSGPPLPLLIALAALIVVGAGVWLARGRGRD